MGRAEHADGAAGAPPWARGARAVAVLTGAGISTDSGIPDFRGPQGLWTRNPGAEKLSTYQAYVSDPAVRRRSWRARRDHPAWRAEPNRAHTALAGLARSGLVTSVITQNIDGLHQKAGTPADRVIELHGTMFSVVCVSCGDRSPMAGALARVDAGEEDPPCPRCGGILKSATVMFGQPLDPDVFTRAGRAAAACDVFLAVGSTLTVEPGRLAVPGRRRRRRRPGHRQPRPHPLRPAGGRGHPRPDRGGRPADRPPPARRHRPGLTPGPRHQAQARTPRGTRPASGGAVSALGWTSGR